MNKVNALQLSYQSAPTKWISLGILSCSATFFMLFSLNGQYDFSYQAINPRLWQYFLAVFSGGALGVAGLLLQKLTKNPLADISLLGIGSLNIIAISLFIYFHFDGEKTSLPQLKVLLPIISLASSIIGTAIVYRLSSKRKSAQSFVISGISFQFFCEAISIAILQFSNKSDKNNSTQLSAEISAYSYGKLPNLGVTSLFPEWRISTILSFVLIAIVSGVVWLYRRELELLEIGNDYAASQGINVVGLKKLLFGLISILAGLESALVGTISLLGIIAPHLARFIFGNKASSNVIVSFICGALLVVLATFISINLDQNIPIGILSTAIITPIFLFLVIKHSR
ncbi:iron ABC transporter permease [Candidatus Mycoplasma haematominutum]|uniref:Ferrichrome ABC transport system permease protein n=1 Tax=Candidatus Mycoplasma haematominutum 'Birmingham 1' TaxID=1116213 RepID=G8C2U9_9MOLU|nr:iron ABC transporter permease [Candidatus Mycoplasma haematominutum]CCE66647.1 ferrichrome ABC transport system permease protein [Candidatus Mycoplasma haematominutum 'Birmingham 1']